MNRQRREIAEQLRSKAKGSGLVSKDEILRLLDMRPYPDTKLITPYCVDKNDVEYLANLIDRPTCHLAEDEEGRTRCARCGCTALYLSEALYCPDCGAEVLK